MATFSLLIPTRQRPNQLQRLYKSAVETADSPDEIEFVVYIDDDDNSYDDVQLPNLKKVRGERIVLSEMWNKCWEASTGNYLMHCGDDIVFRTKGWDTRVKETIDSFPGKLAFVWGNDHNPESQRHEFGTHGFIHHIWAELAGFFVPPYFSSDYNDTWFNDVAKALGIARYLHDVQTEHMHYSLGKAEVDQNTRDRLARHQKDNPEAIYNSPEKRREREIQIEKFRKYLNEFR